MAPSIFDNEAAGLLLVIPPLLSPLWRRGLVRRLFKQRQKGSAKYFYFLDDASVDRKYLVNLLGKANNLM